MDQDRNRRRMIRREAPAGVRFLTWSCYQRLPLMGHPSIRDVFVESLGDARDRWRIELFAWVVMPEHVHLLLRAPEDVLVGPVIRSLKQSMAQRVILRWRAMEAPILEKITDADGVARFWQKGGGFDRNVRDETEFSMEVRYIHHNPVERGLAASPEDWAWSSARWWMKQDDPGLRCDPPPGGESSWGSWRGFV